MWHRRCTGALLVLQEAIFAFHNNGTRCICKFLAVGQLQPVIWTALVWWRKRIFISKNTNPCLFLSFFSPKLFWQKGVEEKFLEKLLFCGSRSAEAATPYFLHFPARICSLEGRKKSQENWIKGFLRYNYHTSGTHTSSLPAQTQSFLQHFPGTLTVFSFGLAQFFGLSGIFGQYSMLNRPL